MAADSTQIGDAPTAPYRRQLTHPNAGSGTPLTIPRRVHADCHLLLWQCRGATTLELFDHRRTLRAGHLCLVQADIEHSLEVGAGATLIPYFLRLGLPAERLPAGATVAVDDGLQGELLTLTQQHLSELLDDGRDTELHIMRRMIAGGRSHGAPPHPESHEAALVAHLVARRPADTRSMATLAHSAYVSLRTIERQFKAETGLTPQQWRAHHCLALASELIASGTPATLVGPQVGYTDPDAFRRAFKAKFGTTPRGASLAARPGLSS